MEEIKGVILKGIGGFYYVSTEEGVFETRARGLFRKQGITPLVGDEVLLRSLDMINKTALLYEIFPRKNEFVRPAVANVSQLTAVISAENPRPNLFLLDKLIVSAEARKTEILICINKTDLNDGAEYAEIYKNAGFRVIECSAETEKNIEELKTCLKDKINVFAGNSGVGKSSLINRLLCEEAFETGEVSKRAERGKHTTRHTELRELPFGGYIIDTPGFGSLEVFGEEAGLDTLFREFAEFKPKCRFMDCGHLYEEGCAVREAVLRGEISKSRYESYKLMEEGLRENKKRQGAKAYEKK